MLKIIFMTIAVLFIGCGNDEEHNNTIMQYQRQIATLEHRNDSLQTLNVTLEAKLDSVTTVADSLKKKVKQGRTLIKFTREKCERYAKIVKRDPSQSTFIVGWIDRAFQWVKEY